MPLSGLKFTTREALYHISTHKYLLTKKVFLRSRVAIFVQNRPKIIQKKFHSPKVAILLQAQQARSQKLAMGRGAVFGGKASSRQRH